jgi:hypothetical protein
MESDFEAKKSQFKLADCDSLEMKYSKMKIRMVSGLLDPLSQSLNGNPTVQFWLGNAPHECLGSLDLIISVSGRSWLVLEWCKPIAVKAGWIMRTERFYASKDLKT